MITDIEGTEPRLFYRLKSTKRKSPLRNAESGVGDVLQYHETRQPDKLISGRKLFEHKNDPTSPDAYRSTIVVIPQESRDVLNLKEEWKSGKKCSFPPLSTEQQPKPTGLKRIEPTKTEDTPQPRGRKLIEIDQTKIGTNSEWSIEQQLGRHKRVEVKDELQTENVTDKSFIKQATHYMAQSGYKFRETSSENYLANKTKKESIDQWKQTQIEKTRQEEVMEDVKDAKMLDSWEKAHLPKKVEEPTPATNGKIVRSRANLHSSNNSSKGKPVAKPVVKKKSVNIVS